MPTRRKLIFLNNYMPKMGLMSGPIIVRILDFLSLHFDVNLVLIDESESDRGNIPKIIPNNKWWWPPTFLRLDDFFSALFLIINFRLNKHDRVLVVYPFHRISIARIIHRISGTKYSVIIHDLHEFALNDNRMVKGLRNAAHLFCVSGAMADKMRQYNANSVVMYPVPGSDLGISPNYCEKDIGIAGTTNRKQLNIAKKLNLDITLVGDMIDKISENGLSIVPRFTNNDDTIKFIARECSAFLVIVPSSSGYYETHSFPSKFLDFCRAGLPVVIIASRVSSVGKWAINNNWILYIDDENDNSQFEKIRLLIRDKKTWLAAQSQVLNVRTQEFNAKLILNKMLEMLNI